MFTMLCVCVCLCLCPQKLLKRGVAAGSPEWSASEELKSAMAFFDQTEAKIKEALKVRVCVCVCMCVYVCARIVLTIRVQTIHYLVSVCAPLSMWRR